MRVAFALGASGVLIALPGRTAAMMQQCEDVSTYEQLRSRLLLVSDPHVPRSTREECERYLNEHSLETCRTASAALQQHAVSSDPLLCWYYISCIERYAGNEFWVLDSSAQQRLLKVRMTGCGHSTGTPCHTRQMPVHTNSCKPSMSTCPPATPAFFLRNTQ